jgi:hypothetical protein
MGLDFLSRFLAQFIDKFKTSSPVLFVVVAALLTGLKYALDAGVFPVDEKILEWVLWAIGLFLGSRTTSFINPTKQ